MHVKSLLHKVLDGAIHQTRINSLLPVIQAIVLTKQLTLTRLGRELEIDGKERAGIRRMDRLLANRYYQEQNISIYQSISRYVVGSQARPLILVDWTSLPNSHRSTESGEHCALRATLAAEGRGITLYDEVHRKKKEGNEQVHRAFLAKLKRCLPVNCCPIIVTDAGFKNPWFQAVMALEWDYVGRVRNVNQTQYDGGEGFKKISQLFARASATPKAIGEITLAKTNPLNTQAYLYQYTLKGRKSTHKNGAPNQKQASKTRAQGYRQPWVLVSSISGYNAAEKVVTIYKKRMTIEENFRDIKSVRYGLSLNENQTVKPERWIVWLMLSALTTLVAWVVGYVAEQKNWHFDFQANTDKHKRILSFFFLGCQVIRKNLKFYIDIKQFPQLAWNADL